MRWLSRFVRLEHEGLPVYLDGERPEWFVPASGSDRLLRCALETGATPPDAERDFPLLAGLLGPAVPLPPYSGRAAHLCLTGLTELWLHLTDRCNLSCRHCLFAASPARRAALDPVLAWRAITEAHALGCRLFFFTGGEPLLYPEFPALLGRVQALDPTSRVVVLSNGLLLDEWGPALAALERERLHLQVSMDGLEPTHDRLRGRGSFARLRCNLDLARDLGLKVTVATALNSHTIDELPAVVRLAAEVGADSLHWLHHFVRGQGTAAQQSSTERLYQGVVAAAAVADTLGLRLDNLESLAAQVFSPPGTRHDLSNAGWQSLAIGPDAVVYPSPALVGLAQATCGPLSDGLETVWRQSPALETIRAASLVQAPQWRESPCRFLTGGGDLDQSLVHSQSCVGADPYAALQEQLALWLIARRARQYPDAGLFRLRMGDVRSECPAEAGGDGSVQLTHCNCVVSLAGGDGRSLVRDYYGAAARETRTEIVNPYGPATAVDQVPAEAAQRSYGCGSPVRAAVPRPGEVLVDLGAGSGVECFLSAEAVGPAGRVYGIDMTPAMLELARRGQRQVAERLGYDNMEFRHGYLEAIPLDDGVADVVISNCVINLSPDKRRTFLEIARVLKLGGRLVVADVVTDEDLPPSLRNNPRLRGECLGGALRQDQLVALLRDCGLERVHLHSRHPYRQEEGGRFFSLTYLAYRPGHESEQRLRAVYRGPCSALSSCAGTLLPVGAVVELEEHEARGFGEAVFLLDDEGVVTNVAQAPCDCALPPEARGAATVGPVAAAAERQARDCMVCGAPLHYETTPMSRRCHYCGVEESSSAACDRGHFVCDRCHQQEALPVIRHLLGSSRETDLLTLLQAVRRHPALPMHGPEHHALLPGVLLTCYRNNGGELSDGAILSGIERGSRVPGGSCGFWGNCGAVIGAGIAAAVILEATPLTPHPRQRAQSFSAGLLAEVARITGGRCCQREAWIVLRETSRRSRELFGVHLPAAAVLACDQYPHNRECLRAACPLWADRVRQRSPVLPLA